MGAVLIMQQYDISMIHPRPESEFECSMSSGRSSPGSDISDVNIYRPAKQNRMASDLFSAPAPSRLYQERRSKHHGDDSFNNLFGADPSQRGRRPLPVNTITGEKIGLKQSATTQMATSTAVPASFVMKIRKPQVALTAPSGEQKNFQ